MARATTAIRITTLAWALAVAAVASAAAFLVDPGSAQQPSAPPAQVAQPNEAGVPPPSQPPLAQGPVPDLDLAFTAQVIGWIEPCG